MHHLTRLISHTFLWVKDDPWPMITCQHDSSPSHIIGIPILIIPCKKSTISKMNKRQKYNLTQTHHTRLLKYFHEISKAWLISSHNLKFSWFELIGLSSNGFVSKEEFLMELSTYLICSWIISATYNFTKILKKKTWVPICKKIDMCIHL
jgi:hypothetical protein